MNTYLWIKMVHIVSATVLFGTGIGTAYYMLRAYLSGDERAFAQTARHVVAADWLFTTPAVVVQLASGLWLAHKLGISARSNWFLTVIGLYLLVGACWIPVVWIQIRVRNLVAAGAARDAYRHLMRIWFALGIPAFGGVLVLVYLMVSKNWS